MTFDATQFRFDSLEQEDEAAKRADRAYATNPSNVSAFYRTLPAFYRTVVGLLSPGGGREARTPVMTSAQAREVQSRLTPQVVTDMASRISASSFPSADLDDEFLSRQEQRLLRRSPAAVEASPSPRRLYFDDTPAYTAEPDIEVEDVSVDAEEYAPPVREAVAPVRAEDIADLAEAFAEVEEALVETKQESAEPVLEEADTLSRAPIPTALTLVERVRDGVSLDQDAVDLDASGWTDRGVFTAAVQMLPSDTEDTLMVVEVLYLNRAAPNVADAVQTVLPAQSLVPLLLIRVSGGDVPQFLDKPGMTQTFEMAFDGALELEGVQELPLFTSFDAAIQTVVRFINDVGNMTYEDYRRTGAGKIRKANPQIPPGTMFRLTRSLRVPGLHRGNWNHETVVQAGEDYVVDSRKVDDSGDAFYIVREPIRGMPWRAKIPADVLERLLPARVSNPSPVLPAAYALTSAVGLSAAVFDLARSLRRR